MADLSTADRAATRSEVAEHRRELRALAARFRLANPRLANDGTVIVTAPDAGYRTVAKFATAATRVVGHWVNTVTDDADAARQVATEAL